MTIAEFTASLDQSAPPDNLAPALLSLWWAKHGDWDKAHKIAMTEGGADGAWVHAYLHRVEGDLPNANYWYRQAGRNPAAGATDKEWSAIVAVLLAPGRA